LGISYKIADGENEMAAARDIGTKIEQIRTSRKLTREQAAERSQLAEELVQQIEDGVVLPSLTPLIKMARVLGVRLGTFLDDVESIGPVVCRKGELRKEVRFSGNSQNASGKLDFYSLAMDKAGRHMEPFLVEIMPDETRTFAPSSHEGEEFVYILSGHVEINYGKDCYRLSEGDSIYYDSIVSHHVHALDGAPAKALAVVYAPC
jgi:transcriptional regulator with XRE-family HTH domain